MPSEPRRKFRQLSDAEKAIGQRVAVCRRFQRWDQWQLAGEIGMSRSQLSSVEIGRVALRTKTAIRIAEVLKINLMWLAKEQAGRIRYLKLPTEIEEKANDHKYFLEAFDAVLRDYFYKDWKSVTERHLAGFYTPDEYRIEVPLQQKALSSLRLPSRRKDILDNTKPPDIFPVMRSEVPTWTELKNSIKRFTAGRGEKTALATTLNVSRQVLGNWLSDDSQGAPNADLTLKLLKWVKAKQGK